MLSTFSLSLTVSTVVISMSSLPLTVSTVLASKLSTNDNKTINTEIVIKRYEDKVFIIISQGNHKIGTLLQGCLEGWK